jgi:hypothetical protein
MSKFIWRFFVIVLLIAAFIPSIAATKTSFVPLIFISIISILFLILELPSTGVVAFIQKRALRFIFACAIFFGAFALFQQGISELTTPSTPTRFLSRIIFETLRGLLGPTNMAILFFVLSIFCVIVGVKYLLTGKVIFFGKRLYKVKNE